MAPTMAISIIPLILIAVLLIAFVMVMLVSPTGRKVLGSIGIILLLLIAGLFYFRTPVGPVSYSSNTVQYGIPEGITEMPSVWQGSIEREFRAEVYSTAEAATFGLGKVIADKHKPLLADPNVKTIVIVEMMDLAVLEEFRQGLKESISDKEIVIQTKRFEDPQEGQVWILLGKVSSNKQQFSGIGNRVSVMDAQVGSMEATLQTSRDKYMERTEFDTRRWIEDMPDFKARHPGHWLVVFSDTASDIGDAQQKTRQKACDLITKAISESASFAGSAPFSMSPGEIDNFGFISDEYTQELQGTSGSIWRNALLLNVSPEIISSLVGSKTAAVYHQRSSKARTILSLAGMVGLIFLVYLFANAVTKGYYSALFGFIAVIAAVMLGIVFLMLKIG